MWKRIACSLTLALLLALTSVIAAGMMAPDRQSPGLRTYELTFGPVEAGLCATGSRLEHHCPFCHGLPKAPVIGHVGLAFLLRPHSVWRQWEELRRAAQARNVNHSPRAPPARA